MDVQTDLGETLIDTVKRLRALDAGIQDSML